jgi:tRNA G18 (ribose-2'-O)-methylase SpoU
VPTPKSQKRSREWSDRFRIARDLPYTIPQTPHARRLLVLERLPGDDLRSALEDKAWGSDDADLFDDASQASDAFPVGAELEDSAIGDTGIGDTGMDDTGNEPVHASDDLDGDEDEDVVAGPEAITGVIEPGDEEGEAVVGAHLHAGGVEVDDSDADEVDFDADDLEADAGDANLASETPHPAGERRSGAGQVPLTGLVAGREVRDIGSDANPTYKLLRMVLAGRGVRKRHRALIAGARPIHEILRDFPLRAVAWITPGASPAPPGDAPASLAWYRLTPALFRQLDVFGTGAPLLLLDAPPLEPWVDAEWPPGCTLFVPFQDPENVGAVVRTAAALGVARVVLLQEAAHPYHPRSARAAGSALLRVPLLRGPAIATFAPQGAPVFALSPQGRDIGTQRFPERFGLLVGLEGPGLPEVWRGDHGLGIPMQPGSESLNAAAATAIALYAWSRSRP